MTLKDKVKMDLHGAVVAALQESRGPEPALAVSIIETVYSAIWLEIDGLLLSELKAAVQKWAANLK